MIIILSIFSWQFTLYYTAIILWYQIFSTEVTKNQSNRPARRNRITRMRLDETDVLLESKQFRKSRLPGQEEWWKEIENDLSRRIRWIRLVESWKLDVLITFYWYMKISAGRTWPPGPQHKKKRIQVLTSCKISLPVVKVSFYPWSTACLKYCYGDKMWHLSFSLYYRFIHLEIERIGGKVTI